MRTLMLPFRHVVKPVLGTPMDPSFRGRGPLLFMPQWEGVGGAVLDLAGNNNATVVGTPGWGQGQFGTAFLFSGSNWLQSAGITNISNAVGTTISFWLYITPGSNTNTTTYFLWMGPARNGRVNFSYGVGVNPTLTVQVSSNLTASLPTTGTWVHVAFTQIQSVSPFPVAIYINGALTTSGTNANTPNSNNTQSSFGYFIGSRGNTTGVGAHTGYIDMLKFHTRALSAPEVAQEYRDTLSIFDTPAILKLYSLGAAIRANVSPTGYVLSAPTSGVAGAPSPLLTITSVPATATYSSPNVITLSDGGAGGTFADVNGNAITTITLNSATTEVSFRYVSNATPGTATLNVDTNTLGFSGGNVPATVAYSTVAFVAAPFTIGLTNPCIFRSPYNWRAGTDNASVPFIQTSCAGAYIKGFFLGQQFAVNFDSGPLSRGGIPNYLWPALRISIDNGPYQDFQLPSVGSSLQVFSTSAGSSLSQHTFRLFVLAFQEAYERWIGTAAIGNEPLASPPNVVRLIGFGVSTDPQTVTFPTWVPLAKRALIPGTSIVEGVQVRGAASGTGTSATATVSGGVVTAITVVTQGTGHTIPPTVTFAAVGAGGGATAHALINSNGNVTSIVVDNGGSGYTSGASVFVFGNNPEITSNDGTQTFAALIGSGLECEYGVLGYGGSGWARIGSGNAQQLYNVATPSNSAWCNYDSTHSRLVGGLLSPPPDYIIIEHATNDPVVDTLAPAMNGGLPAMRLAAPNTPILQLVPAGGFMRREMALIINTFRQGGTVNVTSVGGTYIAGSPIGPDGNTLLIDPDTDLEGGIAGTRFPNPVQPPVLSKGDAGHTGTLPNGVWLVAYTLLDINGHESLISQTASITLGSSDHGSIAVNAISPTQFGGGATTINWYISASAGSSTLVLQSNNSGANLFITAPSVSSTNPPTTSPFALDSSNPNPGPSYQSLGAVHPTAPGHAIHAARYCAKIGAVIGTKQHRRPF